MLENTRWIPQKCPLDFDGIVGGAFTESYEEFTKKSPPRNVTDFLKIFELNLISLKLASHKHTFEIINVNSTVPKRFFFYFQDYIYNLRYDYIQYN